MVLPISEQADVRQRILLASEKLFFQFGVRNMTMDQIATHLGISKKTIYQYFTNKDDLFTKCAQNHMDNEKAQTLAEIGKAGDPVEALLRMNSCTLDFAEGINPFFIMEVKRYYPHVWQMVEDFERDFTRKEVERQLLLGQHLGLFRAEMHAEQVSWMFIHHSKQLVDNSLYPQEYKLTDLFYEYFMLFLHGVCTPLGMVLVQQRLPVILHSPKLAS